MSTSPPTSAGSPTPSVQRVRLDLKGGGWVLLLSLGLVVAVVVWRLSVIQDALVWSSDKPPAPSVSNGFDLSSSVVPVRLIGVRRQRDGMSAIVDPAPFPVAALAKLNESRWTKLLVADDAVIGVTIGGESRAYPTRILTFHEVANDILGGIPIAVTWCPFSGSAVVYDRRLGDQTLVLGISGLVYNGNLLLHDQHDGAGNLWSQLSGRAVAGVAARAGQRLAALPCELLPWGAWMLEQPDTTFVSGDPRLVKQYRTDQFQGYQLSDRLSFPVEPIPEPGQGHPKEPMVLVRTGGVEARFLASEVEARMDPGKSWRTTVGEAPVVFQFSKGRDLVPHCWVRPLDPTHPLDEVRFCYRLAYEAHLGDHAP